MNTPVSFELAKLLKEKGFDLNHEYMVFTFSETEKYPEGELFLKPTIAEVVMWLYEKHEIWIGVICDAGNDLLFTFKIYSTKMGEERCIVNGNMYESPTEDYEAAIEYTLKNLL